MVLFGLIAATGLRVSEALNLRLGDVLAGGVLQIRETKFYKSQYRCMRRSWRYVDTRRRFVGSDDHLFFSMEGSALTYSTVRCAFLRILQLANIAPGRARRPLCVPKTSSELMTWWNRLSWRNDWAVLFRSERPGLAIQVEVAA
jgi:integrase